MYSPEAEIVPGPLRASPPLTFQVTSAPSSAGSVVRNCSTGVPCLLAMLQPVQLVSMAPAPGETEKRVRPGSAATIPPAHPATAISTPGKKKAATRSSHCLTGPECTGPELTPECTGPVLTPECTRLCRELRTNRPGPAEICPQSSKTIPQCVKRFL
jgi:hypothetical protein